MNKENKSAPVSIGYCTYWIEYGSSISSYNLGHTWDSLRQKGEDMEVISAESKEDLKRKIAETQTYKPIGRVNAVMIDGEWVYYQVMIWHELLPVHCGGRTIDS